MSDSSYRDLFKGAFKNPKKFKNTFLTLKFMFLPIRLEGFDEMSSFFFLKDQL